MQNGGSTLGCVSKVAKLYFVLYFVVVIQDMSFGSVCFILLGRNVRLVEDLFLWIITHYHQEKCASALSQPSSIVMFFFSKNRQSFIPPTGSSEALNLKGYTSFKRAQHVGLFVFSYMLPESIAH